MSYKKKQLKKIETKTLSFLKSNSKKHLTINKLHQTLVSMIQKEGTI